MKKKKRKKTHKHLVFKINLNQICQQKNTNQKQNTNLNLFLNETKSKQTRTIKNSIKKTKKIRKKKMCQLTSLSFWMSDKLNFGASYTSSFLISNFTTFESFGKSFNYANKFWWVKHVENRKILLVFGKKKKKLQ